MLCVFAGGPAWSPRTIRKREAVEEQDSSALPIVENYQTIHLVFDTLKPFREAHDAVIRALEKAAAEEERRR